MKWRRLGLFDQLRESSDHLVEDRSRRLRMKYASVEQFSSTGEALLRVFSLQCSEETIWRSKIWYSSLNRDTGSYRKISEKCADAVVSLTAHDDDPLSLCDRSCSSLDLPRRV